MVKYLQDHTMGKSFILKIMFVRLIPNEGTLHPWEFELSQPSMHQYPYYHRLAILLSS